MAQMSKIEKSFSESFAEKKHSISLVNRSEMSLSGVNDVSEFSDSQVMLKTSMGGLCIKGKNLSINQLNTDTGMLDVKGCRPQWDADVRLPSGASGSSRLLSPVPPE